MVAAQEQMTALSDDSSFIGGEHSEVMRRFRSSGQFCDDTAPVRWVVFSKIF